QARSDHGARQRLANRLGGDRPAVAEPDNDQRRDRHIERAIFHDGAWNGPGHETFPLLAKPPPTMNGAGQTPAASSIRVGIGKKSALNSSTCCPHDEEHAARWRGVRLEPVPISGKPAIGGRSPGWELCLNHSTESCSSAADRSALPTSCPRTR